MLQQLFEELPWYLVQTFMFPTAYNNFEDPFTFVSFIIIIIIYYLQNWHFHKLKQYLVFGAY